jgi:hypothetical protein
MITVIGLAHNNIFKNEVRFKGSVAQIFIKEMMGLFLTINSVILM